MVTACRKRKRELGGARYKTRNDGGAKSAEMAVDQWLNLPSGPLGLIFSKLNPVDVILVVPLVCKYWGQIFLERIFCIQQNNNCLSFLPLKRKPFYSFFYLLGDENVRAMKLMSLLVGAMHAFASDSQNDADTGAIRPTPITDIKFPAKLPIHDRHLVYIAERCPELRNIVLHCAKNISGKGISRAMRFWSGMETIVYGPFNEPCDPRLYDLHLPRTIEEIGINCKNLRIMILRGFDFHWQSAEFIVRNLNSLKVLGLHSVSISKYGLQIFLSRCKKLIKLQCHPSCIFINNEGMDDQTFFSIWSIQEGRRIKWSTDIYSDNMGELYTSKELVNLLWKQKR